MKDDKQSPSAPKVESAELEVAAEKYYKTRLPTEIGAKYHFIHGANWQKQQLQSQLEEKQRECEGLRELLHKVGDTFPFAYNPEMVKIVDNALNKKS